MSKGLHKIRIFLSKSSSRLVIKLVLFFLLIVFFNELCFYFFAEGKSFSLEEFGVSEVVSAANYIVLMFSCYYLLLDTNKSESMRYSESILFYRKKYKKEYYRWISLKIGGCFSFTKSVIQHEPNIPINIDNIVFHIDEGLEYELPWVIASDAHDVILEKFNMLDGEEYNGRTLSLRSMNISDQSIEFEFIKSNYYNHLVSNCIPEVNSSLGNTYRDLLEPGPKLNDLEYTMASNHLGMSCMVFTADERVVLSLRGQKTNVFRGKLSPSISGASNVNSCLSSLNSEISLKNWVLNELEDEIPGLCYKDLESLFYIGSSRELLRNGKPEIFLCARTSLYAYDIAVLISNNFKKVGSIDETENEKYIFPKYKSIISGLEVDEGGDVFYLSFENNKYSVSESLLSQIYFLDNAVGNIYYE